MEITANTVQLVTTNQNVLFTDTVIPGNCSMIHRPGSGLVTLRGLTRGQCRSRYKVYFSGNIAVPSSGTAGEISLAIAINGEPVGSSTMNVTQAINAFGNVSSAIYIDVPNCCCSQISIKNVSTQTISVRNANLIVERVA